MNQKMAKLLRVVLVASLIANTLAFAFLYKTIQSMRRQEVLHFDSALGCLKKLRGYLSQYEREQSADRDLLAALAFDQIYEYQAEVSKAANLSWTMPRDVEEFLSSTLSSRFAKAFDNGLTSQEIADLKAAADVVISEIQHILMDHDNQAKERLSKRDYIGLMEAIRARLLQQSLEP